MRTQLRRTATILLSHRLPLSISSPTSSSGVRCFHCAIRTWAIAHPITAHGPPPKAPTPSAEFRNDPRRAGLERQKPSQQQESQTSPSTSSPESTTTRVSQAKTSPLKSRFWKDVNVKESSDGYQILLDTRPVRSPTKAILTVPNTKRHLAEAIALEWDFLTSAQQALKQHLIPLTSLTTRATDIVQEDELGQQRIRQEIARTAMRYLETDTLLCWVPERGIHNPLSSAAVAPGEETLRDKQVRVAKEIINFLTRTIWPGVEIKPVLDENSILPTPQDETTLETIRNWVSGLPAYELAGLERAILASKSLLVAVRLVVEWGEHFSSLQETLHQQYEEGKQVSRFGVEEAARASSLEVTHQTEMWGEVEDTHDVDREDLRRQLGSVILLVSGDRK
ncbi:mitochondrial molecular chaperone (Atp12), putative [Talaromyces stipitatus ATCC 10500]|uniref:Mitochondrial molecular chaperone (Atp12), putative n=1 Tax=Talaromyces stipitatus (strain ATCC 10500 / CBS 375.48 / QM 6759 / NRRL 1006) TaxID=441959 RepID=B8MTY2_TALSN|nr:mitochondrial molecular chaperone (Atp12), putative [Talaromyces stipitatus ATCC 10500]EED12595.1 mitochondrial molecular chaperone (Atp12), putative [Talaromyces stipitatus ATCC 10500]